jgi:HD-GYP domain-containing protein (c-di-GMP phosphodiesterase class II)
LSDHQDALEALNHHAPLSEKLKTLHDALNKRFEFIDRVAVAIYDPKTDELKTFIHSSGEANPLAQGAHLERMSRYARIVAKELAPKYGFDDEYVEHVFLFSPLHDIGKIGIPDSVLLKAGLLDANEREVMKTHSQKGRQLIDNMLRDFGLESFQYLNMLRNIAEHHHETLDGAGYPHRLRGDDIPIESRIVAVADVFDALTSKRPYKEAWNMDDAFQELRKLAGSKLDFDCVEALIKNRAQLEEIRDRFQESPFL